MSKRNTILMLEDNDERIESFQAVVATLSPPLRLKVWFDAPAMIAESPPLFDEACLFSLDHDLNQRAGANRDPGDGLEVAKFLALKQPICPVLIHSSNYERAWSMHNEFRFAGWTVDRIGPIGDDWIQRLWLPKVQDLLKCFGK